MKTYKNILKENRAWAEELFSAVDKKMSAVTVRSRSKLPDGVDKNGVHVEKSVDWWTNGFWGGLNYLLYNRTKKEDYLLTAKESEKLLDRAFTNYEKLHHDVGFMWHILSGASYRLTGNKDSLSRELYTASMLSSRFVLGGNFIRAWNGKHFGDCSTDNWTIIDTMMNLPLLYAASDILGDDRFKRIAMAHADNTLRTHLRPDGSVAHIVEHDRESGDAVATHRGQGYAVGSSWSRGQAWAIYGFALSYIHTGEQRYLDAAKRVANYFIAEVSDTWLPRLDFRQPEAPLYYDSTAGAIAACGMLEIAKHLPEEEGGAYASAAVSILRAMSERFLNLDPATDDMLNYGSVRYPNPIQDKGPEGIVHISIIYGDFFFVEALLKLLGDDFLIW